LPLKIRIGSKKTRFWKEKSIEDVVTLGPTAHATLVSITFRSNPKIFGVFTSVGPSLGLVG
jgi:hypothetical protein